MKHVYIAFILLGLATVGAVRNSHGPSRHWFWNYNQGIPSFSNVQAPTTVQQFSKYEVSFSLTSACTANIYDPACLDVNATFAFPGSSSVPKVTVFCFPFQLWQRTSSTSETWTSGCCYSLFIREVIIYTSNSLGAYDWRCRFATGVKGAWTVTVTAKDSTGSMREISRILSSKLHFHRQIECGLQLQRCCCIDIAFGLREGLDTWQAILWSDSQRRLSKNLLGCGRRSCLGRRLVSFEGKEREKKRKGKWREGRKGKGKEEREGEGSEGKEGNGSEGKG